MTENLDTIAVLGGPSLEESIFRVDAAVQEMTGRDVPTLSLIGGSWAFQADQETLDPMANRMKTHAIEERDVDEADIITIPGTHDTIGDACLAKGILATRGLFSLGLVTSESHLPRATRVFGHVLGEDYHVEPISAGAFPGRRGQRLYEAAGSALEWAVLKGTEPGDDVTIKHRLERLVPGYLLSGMTRRQFAANHLKNVLGRSIL